MEHFSSGVLLFLLLILIVLSAFFSSSETSMMAINRYRLRHQVAMGNKAARLIELLLAKTDTLIATILIGNNFVNILATIVAGVLASRWLAPIFGAWTELVTAVIITFIFLVFAEVTPKTIAARKPELIAYPASLILYPLRFILFPSVWLIGKISYFLLWLLRLGKGEDSGHHLNMQELRTMVRDAGALIPNQYQSMLLNIIDIEGMTVNDIMIPRNEVEGVDINDGIDEIVQWLQTNMHTRLPVFKEDLNNIVGVIHTRNIAKLLQQKVITKKDILAQMRKPYFVQEGTPLHTQLVEFQNNKRRLGVVVDEYGDVQGIVAMEDILEEIVGEFTTSISGESKAITRQKDGSYVVDGTALVREVNRALGGKLPTRGAKTINGLITEQLQCFPEANVSLVFGDMVVETLAVESHIVRTTKIYYR